MKGPYDLTWGASLWLVAVGVAVSLVYLAIVVVRARREKVKPRPLDPIWRSVGDDIAAGFVAVFDEAHQLRQPELGMGEGSSLAYLTELLRAAATPAPARTEPIKLTREQIDMLTSEASTPTFDHGNALGHLTGIPIIEVATVEESTPYVEGWISR